MKKIITALLCLVNFAPVSAGPYDTSDDVIKSSHNRTDYFLAKSTNSAALNFEQFIAKADRGKGVVVHSHGCGGVIHHEKDLMKFYTGIDYHFLVLDFNKRSDAVPSCTYRFGRFNYHGDMAARVPVRHAELMHHIKLLRSNGFNKIIATGHSEGGFVVQMIDRDVDGVIIHAMFCNPMANFIYNNEIKFLHLVSFNDPFLTRPGLSHVCNNRSNYQTVVSQVSSHDPLADSSWKEVIKDFLEIR
jgi:predicted esterase